MSRKIGAVDLIMPVAELWIGSQVNLGRLEKNHMIEEKDWESSKYVRNQRLLGRCIHDNTVFTADSIRLEPDGVKIKGSLTKYGSALVAQDSLEWELLNVVASYVAEGRTSPSDFASISKALPLRNRVEKPPRSYLVNPLPDRCNAIAIATVIVYNAGGDNYRVMFGKRSGQTAAHADLCHVIPAGMFQPELGDVATEWSIKHNVLKEYGEELFSERIDESFLDATYFYSQWLGVASLLGALDEGKCELLITGLVVNLFNLRPEICCLLLVRDHTWWAQQKRTMRPNWEYAPRQKILDTSKRVQSDFSLASIEQEFGSQFAASAGMWVPPGLAALWLGVDAARRALV
jgi:hypothetical protein